MAALSLTAGVFMLIVWLFCTCLLRLSTCCN